MDECRHRIRRAREARGLSQEQLAQTVGRSVRSIGRFESGESEPSVATLRLLAEALDVSLAWLLTGEGQGPTPAPMPLAVPDVVATSAA
jgi:transcriptional regulator with XRE-family HTH domain